eukprot:jgi/Botrbrau1/4689/Bobra.0218s0011.1
MPSMSGKGPADVSNGTPPPSTKYGLKPDTEYAVRGQAQARNALGCSQWSDISFVRTWRAKFCDMDIDYRGVLLKVVLFAFCQYLGIRYAATDEAFLSNMLFRIVFFLLITFVVDAA